MARYSPYKMKGHTLPGIKQRQSPAKQKMEKIPSKKAERLATSKTGRVMQNVLGKSVSKESDTEAIEREGRFKHTSKRTSPAKCPLVAALAPAVIGAVGGMIKKKKEEE